MPQKYKNQIANTNFNELTKEVNTFLRKTILPEVNKYWMENPYILPFQIGQYLKNPLLKTLQNYIFIGTDLRPLFNPKTHKSNAPVKLNIV